MRGGYGMKRLAALCAAGVMLLSACGGDGGDETSAGGGVTTTAHDMAGGQHTDHVGNPTIGARNRRFHRGSACDTPGSIALREARSLA